MTQEASYLPSPLYLYDLQTVAAILKVSKRTVQRLIYAKRLKAKRLTNRIVRVAGSDIENFIRTTGNEIEDKSLPGNDKSSHVDQQSGNQYSLPL